MRPSHFRATVEGVTVIDIFRAKGVETRTELTVSAGVQAQARYYAMTGHQPIKDNRRKTNDPKSVHCFAIYPKEFVPMLEAIVEAIAREGARQGDLFR